MTSDDLRLEIDASRRALRQDYAGLCDELNFVAKTKRAVVQHPLPFIGGAAFLGYLFSGRRGRKARKGEAAQPAKTFTLLGVLLPLAKLLLPLAQPYFTDLAARKVTDFATKFRR